MYEHSCAPTQTTSPPTSPSRTRIGGGHRDVSLPRQAGLQTPPCGCIAHQFAEIAGAVAAAPNIREARRIVVDRGARLLSTPWVALTRGFEPDELGFVAVSEPAVRRLARIEQRLREGPGWHVQSDGHVTVVDDLHAEHRWPGYCREVIAETPVRSVIGLPLQAGPETLGALVAYADAPRHFAGPVLHHARLLGTHAATALSSVASRTKADNLEVALQTNREIGTAIGIVMNRLRLTDDRAFDHLREVSQHRHMKLVDLAARIVLTGEVPELHDQRPTSGYH